MLKKQNTFQAFPKLMTVVLALAILLAACAPQATPTQDAQAQIATSVALTVAAQKPLETATATSTPTEIPAAVVPTLTPILPTATTFVVIPPPSGGSGGSGGSGSGGGSTSTQSSKYKCSVVAQTPNDGSPATILKVGDTLDVKWTLRNDGTKTWEAAWPWAFYSSSVSTNVPANSTLTMSSVGFQTSLGANVKPGETVTLGVELTAPNFEGRDPIRITTSWTVIGDGVKFCRPWINVEIIRPGMTP